MKKAATLMAMLLLLTPLAAMAGEASQGSANLLWDIPFGVSEREFMEGALAGPGISFVPSKEGGNIGFYQISAAENQALSFLGHPLASATADFRGDSDGASEYLGAMLTFDIANPTPDEMAGALESISAALDGEYGKATLSGLAVEDGYFSFPMTGGRADYARAVEIFREDDSVAGVFFCWNNLFFMYGDIWGETSMVMRVSPEIAAFGEIPFHGEYEGGE